MKNNQFRKMLAFLEKLDKAKIAFDLRRSRVDAIMVKINVPGQRWEVEFLQDGEIEVERFSSEGEIHDESKLEDLFAQFSDEEASPKRQARANASVTRK
jgi:hypothetical protein